MCKATFEKDMTTPLFHKIVTLINALSTGVKVVSLSAVTYIQRWRTMFLVNISFVDYVITMFYSSVIRVLKTNFLNLKPKYCEFFFIVQPIKREIGRQKKSKRVDMGKLNKINLPFIYKTGNIDIRTRFHFYTVVLCLKGN